MAYVGGLDVGGVFAVLIVVADLSLAGGELAILSLQDRNEVHIQV